MKTIGECFAPLLSFDLGILIAKVVTSMSVSLSVPVSTKIRLCPDPKDTLQFAQLLECAGSSWVTLHARQVSTRRRRQGAADLSVVKRLKEGLGIPVVSNGNVRCFGDIAANLKSTGADGIMVGEALLNNPWYVILLVTSCRTVIDSEPAFSQM